MSLLAGLALMAATIVAGLLILAFLRLGGFSGHRGAEIPARPREAGTVLEPFVRTSCPEMMIGKVVAGGEVWDAHCKASLGATLRKDDRVMVTYNGLMSLVVESAIERAA